MIASLARRLPFYYGWVVVGVVFVTMAVGVNARTAFSLFLPPVLDEFGWNERNTPYEKWYPEPALCPAAFNGQGLVIRLETTLADDMTFSGVAFVEEEG